MGRSGTSMDTPRIYFAYGAGLPPDFDFVPGERPSPGGVAYLPDHEAVFGDAGSLCLRPRRGYVVGGVFYELSTPTEPPSRIHPDQSLSPMVALSANGDAFSVQLHRAKVVAETTPEPAVLTSLRDARTRFGLETPWLGSADTRQVREPLFTDLFIYGTLMRGECRFKILERDCGIQDIQEATARGRLLDLGAYPGMVEAGHSESSVRGEVCTLRDPEKALGILDEVEEFLGWNRSPSMYERVLISVCRSDGSRQVAWTYRLAEVPSFAQEISGGDWRSRAV